MPPPLVQLEDIRKSFGARKALDGAGLTLHQGEILGLVGDNGAGKSTLLKILSGDLRRDGGRILIKGRETEIGGRTRPGGPGSRWFTRTCPCAAT